MDVHRGSGEILRYGDGEVVFREGDEGRHVYFVLSGAVQIRKEGSQFASGLGRCVAGDCFGEMSVVDAHPRSATAFAVGETELARYDREAFFDVVRQDPEVAVSVIASLGSKLRNTSEELQKVRAAYLRSRSEARPVAED